MRRRVEIATLAARTGVSYAVHRAKRVLTPASQRAGLDAAFEMRTAADVTEALGNMKGVMMKLGQILSYADDGLPEALRTSLAQLQQDAPPMSAHLAAGMVEQELGAPPDRVFASWDEVPMAAASIGQVHRATTHDGDAVAVKVQYPGAADAISSDAANAGFLFSMLSRLFPGMDPGPIAEEIRVRLLEELDYRQEADNQRLFAAHYAGHPFITVPRVVDQYSTGRVLTTELGDGVRFEELETWAQPERNAAAEAIFRFVHGSLHRLHAFNGDPHPGNYLFGRDGRVTFLDFGLVKRFTDDEVLVLRRLAETMVIDRDLPAFRSVIEGAGFLPAGAPFSDDLIGEYFGHFSSFLLDEQPVTFTPEYASATVRRLLDNRGPYSEIMKAGNAPPFAVILQRINIGLVAILGRLRATADWRAIAEDVWPFVGAEPTTELGRLDAEWRVQCGR